MDKLKLLYYRLLWIWNWSCISSLCGDVLSDWISPEKANVEFEKLCKKRVEILNKITKLKQKTKNPTYWTSDGVWSSED
jgi:hypothetical protein